MNWLFIKTKKENGIWFAKWRWDNAWMDGLTKEEAIRDLKRCSI